MLELNFFSLLFHFISSLEKELSEPTGGRTFHPLGNSGHPREILQSLGLRPLDCKISLGWPELPAGWKTVPTALGRKYLYMIISYTVELYYIAYSIYIEIDIDNIDVYVRLNHS